MLGPHDLEEFFEAVEQRKEPSAHDETRAVCPLCMVPMTAMPRLPMLRKTRRAA